MKKSLYILAALTALVSCSKELDIQNQEKPAEQVKNESNVHELFASLPEIVDDETKAEINDGTGVFSWEENDAIAVVTDGGNVYKFVYTASSEHPLRFTYAGNITGTPTTIYFPWVEGYTATQYANMSVPTSVTGLTGALSDDAIRLTGPITQSEGKYVSSLSYRNAFLRVTIKDVPAFATSIGFDIKGDSAYDNVDDVTVNFTLTGKQDIVAYIPVTTGDKYFAITLKDAKGNYILRQETNEVSGDDPVAKKSFTAGTLKTMKPLTVGHVLKFGNSTWSSPKVHIWDSNSHTADFTTAGSYPNKLNQSSAGNYYVVLNTTDFSWASEGTGVGVQFTTTSNSPSTQTNCVYLYRDIDFTIPNGGGMNTDYRIYYDNSTNKWSNIGIYTWLRDYRFYFKNTSSVTDLFCQIGYPNGSWTTWDASEMQTLSFDNDTYYWFNVDALTSGRSTLNNMTIQVSSVSDRTGKVKNVEGWSIGCDKYLTYSDDGLAWLKDDTNSEPNGAFSSCSSTRLKTTSYYYFEYPVKHYGRYIGVKIKHSNGEGIDHTNLLLNQEMMFSN